MENKKSKSTYIEKPPPNGEKTMTLNKWKKTKLKKV